MISRRQFLEVVSAGGVGLVLAPRFSWSQAATAPAPVFTDLRAGVGIFTARGGTIGWFVSSDAVVVVDSQFADTAQLCLDGLRAKNSRPIDLLINTHHHGDHTAGNKTLKAAATRVLAHANVPALQRAAAEQAKTLDAQVYADRTFTDVWQERTGREVMHARHFGPAHTSGDAVVTFEHANVVHMGDLVFHRVYPFIDRRSGGSIANWIVVLEKAVEAHDPRTQYIFGHGAPDLPVVGSRSDVLAQRDFLTALLDTARKGHAAGESKEQLQARTSIAKFEAWRPLGTFVTMASLLGVAYDEVVDAPRQ
jgi:cyclase